MIKKQLLYILAIGAILVACSSEGGEATQNYVLPSEDVVNIAVATEAITDGQGDGNTRGTGTVGSTNPAENQWAGQSLRVYMFNKGTLIPTKMENDEGQKVPIMENVEVFAPNGVDVGPVSRERDVRSYYPISGASDFWGYRTDGAETATPSSDGKTISVPICIDGTQDIMAGATRNVLGTEHDEDYYFSAKSAREGIVPTLDFKHMLTRLTFEAKAYKDEARYSEEAQMIEKSKVVGNESSLKIAEDAYYCSFPACDKISLGIFIDSIMVETPTKGKFTFAFLPTSGKQAMVEWDNSSVKRLHLMQREDTQDPTKSLVPMKTTMVPRASFRRLGEALLIPPSETIKLRIAVHQYIYKYDAPQSYIRQETIWPTLDLPPVIIDLGKNTGKGTAGYSYNIQLGVSGLELIVLNGMLQPWQDGGNTEKEIE